MISVNIPENAGFGNCLFVIAAAYGHAKKIGTQWAITEKSWGVFAPYEPYLKCLFNTTELSLKKYQEKGFHYEPIEGNNIELVNSYFQSYKYYEHCLNEIRELFSPTDELKRLITKFEGDTCAISVRRGDYLQLSHYHYNLQLDYYKQAMEIMGKKNFIVFSNDIEWCKNQDLFKDCEFFQDGDGTRTWEDLKDFYTMSGCRNFILSNSTFCYWAQEINSNKEKVIAPKNWFAGKKELKNTKDLYTKEMIVI